MQRRFSVSEQAPDLWAYLADAEKPILLYGMGNGADKILDVCAKRGIKVSGVFASDGFVRNKSFHSFPVTTYAAAKERVGDMIVLVSFATSLPDVIENILRIASEQELYIPDVPVYGEEIFDYSFVQKHGEELRQARALFSDEESRQLFDGIIRCKLYGSISLLRECSSADPDGLSTLLHPKAYRTSVDLGAFTGDTALRLRTFAPNLERMICFEPDPKTFVRLRRNLGQTEGAELYPYAAWDKEETLPFRFGGSRSSRLSEEGKLTPVTAMPIDAILKGAPCDFIKYDVEGAELPALHGSAGTIRVHRPELLVSLYHRSEDLFVLPLALHGICPHYEFFLRRAPSLPAWDLNLLGVPKKH